MDSLDSACTSAFSQLDPTEAFCALPPDSWRWTHPLESVRSDFGLFCDTSWLLDLSNSAFFSGFFIGAAAWGIISDNVGRFGSLIGACVVSGIFTALTAAVSSYRWFVVLRILSGASPSPHPQHPAAGPDAKAVPSMNNPPPLRPCTCRPASLVLPPSSSPAWATSVPGPGAIEQNLREKEVQHLFLADGWPLSHVPPLNDLDLPSRIRKP